MANNTVFDDAYKTLVEKFPSLIIPLINEQFGRNYSEDEAIENLSGELQKPAGDIAADSIFRIKRRIYHVECQSNPDDTMAVRMLEYDFYTAMRNVKKDEKGEYIIEFPKSAVLYLRHNKNTPDEMSVKVKVSNELSFDYKTPIIKAQLYSLEDLLEKSSISCCHFICLDTKRIKN